MHAKTKLLSRGESGEVVGSFLLKGLFDDGEVAEQGSVFVLIGRLTSGLTSSSSVLLWSLRS